jgi:hypothetical protein
MFTPSGTAEGQQSSIRKERSLIAICLMRRRTWQARYLPAGRICIKLAWRFWLLRDFHGLRCSGAFGGQVALLFRYR